jgi:hypothetical protein
MRGKGNIEAYKQVARLVIAPIDTKYFAQCIFTKLNACGIGVIGSSK